MLEFPYLAESAPRTGSRTHPVSRPRFRPFVPLRILCPGGVIVRIPKALLDTGSQDSVLPLAIATTFGIPWLPNQSHGVSWRGSFYPLHFATVSFRLVSHLETCEWVALVGFSPAPIPYPLLGLTGFLEYFDATFLGEEQRVELASNASFSGTVSAQR